MFRIAIDIVILFIYGFFEFWMSFSSIYFCFSYLVFYFFIMLFLGSFAGPISGVSEGKSCVFKYVISLRTGCWMYETSKSLIYA